MKQVRFGALTLAGAIMLSSCASSFQASSGTTGAMIGSHVGEAIGIISGRGHYNGHNAALGSLIGMGVGAALGVSIASHIEKKAQKEYEDGYNRRNKSKDTYGNEGYSSPDYQTGGGIDSDADYTYNNNRSSNAITISPLSYMDTNGDGYFSKGEVCEIETFITNNSDAPMRDLTICLNVEDNKNYYHSPSLTTTLQPGQRIRYTGRVSCKKARKGEGAKVCITAVQGNTTYTSNELFISTK